MGDCRVMDDVRIWDTKDTMPGSAGAQGKKVTEET